MPKGRPTRKTVMKPHDARFKLNLAAEWNDTCIVCGRAFDSLACVTIEHIIPKSKGGTGRWNKAPSHHNCNKLKGVLPLTVAARLVEERLAKMSESCQRQWLNKAVPNRIVPPEAMYDLTDARWFFLQWIPGFPPGVMPNDPW